MVETDVEFIAKMKALAEKATPGPWRVSGGDNYCVDADAFPKEWGHQIPASDENGPHLAGFGRPGDACLAEIGNRPSDFGESNAAFVAAARTAIPRLLGMVLDREIDRDAQALMRRLNARNGARAEAERDAALSRAEAAESAQREAVAEVARIGRELGKAQAKMDQMRAALEYYAADYDHTRKCSQWDGGAKARAALASKE